MVTVVVGTAYPTLAQSEHPTCDANCTVPEADDGNPWELGGTCPDVPSGAVLVATCRAQEADDVRYFNAGALCYQSSEYEALSCDPQTGEASGIATFRDVACPCAQCMWNPDAPAACIPVGVTCSDIISAVESDGGPPERPSCGTGACQRFAECNSKSQYEPCDPGEPGYEQCANDEDDDCDGVADEQACELPGDDDEGPPGAPDDPDDPEGDPEPVPCAQCDRCDAAPVDLLTREMYVGPHEDVRIESGIGPSWDIAFARRYDSTLARADFAADQALLPSEQQRPYVRVLGWGWRHSYGDRLLLRGDGAPANPTKVVWQSLEKTVDFHPSRDDDDGTRHYDAEIGRAETLRRIPGVPVTWSLTTMDGDRLDFVEGPATLLHPVTDDPERKVAGVEHHVRLKYIWPRHVPGYRLHVQHEQDLAVPRSDGVCADVLTADSTCPLGAEECRQCDAARGLLRRVVVEWILADGSVYPGNAVELQYERPAVVAGAAEVLRLVALRDGTPRVESPSAVAPSLVEYAHRGSSLKSVYEGRGCGQTEACESYRYSYSSEFAWPLSVVSRRIATESGSDFAPVETFGWEENEPGRVVVATHESAGVSLRATLRPFRSDLGETGSPDDDTWAATWLRNDWSEERTFDGVGDPLTCSGGGCGHPNRRVGVQFSKIRTNYPLGAERRYRRDGVVALRRNNEKGLVEIEAEVEAANPSPLTSEEEPRLIVRREVGYDVVTLQNVAGYRHVKRHYYTPEGRLWVTAELAGDAGGEIRFPLDGDGEVSWFSSEVPAPTPLRDIDLGGDGLVSTFEVTVVRTVDGDGTVNGPYSYLPECTLTSLSPFNVRNDCALHDRFGRIVSRTTSGADFWDQLGFPATAYAYFDIASSAPSLRGRRRLACSRVQGDVEIAGSCDEASASPSLQVTWRACPAEGSPYDELGRPSCWERPGSLADPAGARALRTEERDSVGADGSRTTKTTQSVSGEVLLESYLTRLPSGFVSRSGTVGGNSRRFWQYRLAAVVGLTPDVEQRLDIFGVPLDESRTTRDSYGRVTLQTLHDDEGRLRRQQLTDDRVGPRGLPTTTVSGADGIEATTTRAFNAFDQPIFVLEPDGDEIENVYGVTGTSLGRLELIRRGPDSFVAYQHDEDGRVVQIRGPAMTGGPADGIIAEYAYDERGSLIEEMQHVTGVMHAYNHDALGRLVRKLSTSLTGVPGAPIDLRYLYDALGRLVMVTSYCSGMPCEDGVESLFVYDSKGPAYAGVYTPAAGRSIALTDDHQAGRLAFSVDRDGATFFEYDGLGRVSSVVRHDGRPSGLLDADRMTATNYTYGQEGQLLTIRYPSGKVVEYIYCRDKERPCAVKLHVGDDETIDVVTGIRWEPSGVPKIWRWGGLGGQYRSLDFDILGRIRSIVDSFDGADPPVSRVDYDDGATGSYDGYDGDGDVLHEEDNSRSHTMLALSSTEAAVGRRYGYTAGLDYLAEWRGADDVLPRSSISYDAAGRRETEYIGEGAADSMTQARLAYRYTGEALDSRLQDVPAGTDHNVIVPAGGRDRFGRIRALQLGGAPGSEEPPDVELEYGVEGNVTAILVDGAGTFANGYDAEMRRTRILAPLQLPDSRVPAGTTFRYGVGAEVLEETERILEEQLGGLGDPVLRSRKDEHVYLFGQRIATMRTLSESSPGTPPGLFYALTDRMGVVRKYVDAGGAVVARLVMDPWGDGVEVRATNDARAPRMAHRYAGQFADELSGPGRQRVVLVNNRYRTYLPQVGMYTSPDPLHSVALENRLGTQAYPYANSRPLSFFDPDGRYYVDGSWDLTSDGRQTKEKVELGLEIVGKSKACKCAFQVYHGRIPFNDQYPIRYSNRLTGVNAEGLPFTAIDIFVLGRQQTASHLASTIGHEMAHTSFDAKDEYTQGSSPTVIITPGSPTDIGAWCGGKSGEIKTQEMCDCLARDDCL